MDQEENVEVVAGQEIKMARAGVICVEKCLEVYARTLIGSLPLCKGDSPQKEAIRNYIRILATDLGRNVDILQSVIERLDKLDHNQEERTGAGEHEQGAAEPLL